MVLSPRRAGRANRERSGATRAAGGAGGARDTAGDRGARTTRKQSSLANDQSFYIDRSWAQNASEVLEAEGVMDN